MGRLIRGAKTLLARLKKIKLGGSEQVCVNCLGIKRVVPNVIYQKGYTKRNVSMCDCGSDTFEDINLCSYENKLLEAV